MKFNWFRIYNYRNIHDSQQIDINQITAFVGQNESGKSNLFEALYRLNPYDEKAEYDIDEDWPADKWGEKHENEKSKVCEANFILDNEEDILSLFKFSVDKSNDTDKRIPPNPPKKLEIIGTSYYDNTRKFSTVNDYASLTDEFVNTWAKENLPKFVFIHDYEMSGSQSELNQLKQRRDSVSWDELTNDEQTILIVLELAKIDIDELHEKGTTPDGRTIRAFDTVQASKYLTNQFKELWRQKKVDFTIHIDGTTLNIFAEDEKVGMPIRLKNRSTGFRWYVSFAWKFTHASKGKFANCVILLEEPGIHLHYDAQQDLISVFERLKDSNTILYTTHLASMVDKGYPERVRIVEEDDNNLASVKSGVVSNKKAPMAVIEMTLGLTGNMSGLLGNRKTLIVEGGDDAIILNKLSAVLKSNSKSGLDDTIYLWPAQGATKTPMYAAFAIGQNWRSGVLLDSDEAGMVAKKKINDLFLKKLSEAERNNFQVIMINEAADLKKTDASIEDLFPKEFYLNLVNEAYSLNIKLEDLPKDGSDMITKRIEKVLNEKFSISNLDKGRIMGRLMKKFEEWNQIKDLPKGTVEKSEKLFNKINNAIGELK